MKDKPRMNRFNIDPLDARRNFAHQEAVAQLCKRYQVTRGGLSVMLRETPYIRGELEELEREYKALWDKKEVLREVAEAAGGVA